VLGISLSAKYGKSRDRFGNAGELCTGMFVLTVAYLHALYIANSYVVVWINKCCFLLLYEIT